MSRLQQAIQAAGKPLATGDDGFSKLFTFAPDFIGFDGHFPDQPILPAVVQLMAGAAAAAEAADIPLAVKTVSRAKFLKQVSPGDTLNVTGKLTTKDGNTVAAIKIMSGSDTAATFTLTLTGDRQ